MSTRSDIIVQRADGSWSRQYCHFDGYLEGVGQTLLDSFQDQAKVDDLSRLGDLSSLGPRIDKPEGHSFANKVEGCTVAYGRDRGETGTEATIGDSLAAVWPPTDTWTEYTYVYAPVPGGSNEPQWFVGDPDIGPSSLVPLRLALADPDNYAPKPDVKAPWGVLWHRDDTRAQA